MVYPGTLQPRGGGGPRGREKQDVDRTPVYRQLWFYVLIAIVLGIAFGLLFEEQALKAQWLADAFIQLIKAVTGPVIFVTVVIGIASLGDMARAGGLALRALGYFLVMTVVALALGLIAGNLVKPGAASSGRGSDAATRGREGVDRRGRRRPGLRRLHHRRPAADELRPAVRGERDPARAGARDPRRGGHLRPRRSVQREQVVARLRGRSQIIFGDHPADHVGRAARRVRRHGVHGAEVRRRLADEPRRC